jgi:dipeptidyl aminopeptidase/acylaminoacyl peptidase
MYMSKRPITANDLLSFTYVGDPQLSPQGTSVAYVRTQMDVEKNGYYSSIYLSQLEDGGRQYTFHYSSEELVKDTSPRWSPDGKRLAFLSNRTGKNQVWMLFIDGGEATQITDVDQGISEFVWSPDGQQLALSIKGELLLDDAGFIASQEETKEEQSDVKVITRLRYKADGIGILDEDRKHIFLLNLHTSTYTKISEGDFDFGQPSFSPDGKKLIYLGSKDEDQEWHYIASIWQYDMVSKKEELFYKGKGAVTSPSFSPDGKWIAFVGHDRGELSSGNSQVWAVSTVSGEDRNLSASLDHTVGNLVGVDAKYDTGNDLRLVWDQSSSHIYFIATVGGDVQLFKTSLEGKVSEALTSPGHSLSSFDIVNTHQAILVQAHPTSTGDLVLQSLGNQAEVKMVTNWNQSLSNEVHLSVPEQFTYKSKDGWDIEGWILKPYGFEEGKKYPLILQIHGGPHTSYGNGLHHEFQLMAAKGYVVLYTNPRGSHGYGEEFVRACVGDWGGMDYEDIMAGVDYSVDTFSFIDKEQLFVTGGSYGGFMTNMIVTRTNRFKAAVTQRSICNIYSFYGTSDIGFYFGEWQLGDADLWEDEEKIMKFSPIRYARNVKTPTLILHSEQDIRCPMEQAEQWYVALRRLGVETKLVRFPDENHDLSRSGKPKHRLERLEHIIGWFEDRKL